MYSKTFSVAIQGIEGHMVQIEADISDGLPVFSLVGDLSCETKEAKERVRVALQNTGFRFPPRRVKSIFHRQISGRMVQVMIWRSQLRYYLRTVIFPNLILMIYCLLES